ncbi:MAG: SIS domain-containing protein [Acidobacteria bacterium]|nr:MAG: SIS domain-containing protein [Acidobacteriota bacterium]
MVENGRKRKAKQLVSERVPGNKGPNTQRAGMAFFDQTMCLLQELRRTQGDVIQKAAELCAERIARGGLVFLFGNGHSRMMCEEMTPRQGCYAGFVALVETALSNHAAIVGANGLRAPLYLENYEGYAEQILRSFHFGPNDAFIVISTSGIRPVVVEMAMGAQERGLPVVAIVSKAHCEEAKPAHSSGKKLTDCADVVIDNLCPPGDCVLELEGLEWRTGPVSTITGAMIINMIRCAAAESLLKRGVKPVVLPSHQFVGNTGAAEQLEAFYEAYRKTLKHLFE